MKTQLLKCMPHVPLQKLRPELEEQNMQHSDEGIEDLNAVGGQDEAPVNGAESIEAAKDTAATFQYAGHDHQNSVDLGPRSRRTEVVPRKIKQFWNKRQRQNRVGQRSSETETINVGQHTPFGLNESSESDSEEDFQDGIPLLRRT